MKRFLSLVCAAGVMAVVVLAAGALQHGTASAQTAPASPCTTDPTNGALLCPAGTSPSTWGSGYASGNSSAQSCYTTVYGTTACYPAYGTAQSAQNCYTDAYGSLYCYPT